MAKPIVAIVGRPNVGKSALFNRLVGQRLAIVEDIPGTTRDRLYAEVEWGDTGFMLVDTGGLDLAALSPNAAVETLVVASADYVAHIHAQVVEAMTQADVILFVVDVVEGVTAADRDVARMLRKEEGQKPIMLVANKADNPSRTQDAVEFYQLGLENLFTVSALHGTGTGDLLEAVVEALESVGKMVEDETVEEGAKLSIIGRPNVGKSSLLNALLGQPRAIVSSIPGTTRDALDTPFDYDGQQVLLIDTAGIRRRGRIQRGIEKYSILRAMRAIERSDVVLHLLDADQGPTAQDAHVAGYALEAMKGIIVIINKWDLVVKDTGTMAEYTQRVRAALRFLDYVPVLFISAKTRQRVNQVLPTALRVATARQARISTGEINRQIEKAVFRHAPPSKGGKRLRFYYTTQAGVAPPTFVCFVNDPKLVHFSYERYLENVIREVEPFEGTPIRLIFRGREEPRS